MSRIVYLLGAGASYGKRNDNEPKDSQNWIEEGLPIVNEINDEIDVVIKWLSTFETTEDRLYTFKGPHDFSQMKEELIEGLQWLKEKSSQHATIDTFAKKLYLQDDRSSDYGRLKLLLASFFLIEQSIHKYDKRYDTFFANILNGDCRIPNDIYIMTWNYDCQLDIAYREYNQWGLPICVPVEPNCDTDKSKVFKINGSANFYNINQIDAEIHRQETPFDLLDRIFRHFGETYKTGKYSSGTTDLFFAWEKNTFNEKSKWLYKKLADTKVLIVIGYTFPFFNREIDREIFSKMPSLEKIYIQDPYAEDVKEFLYSVLTDEQRKGIYPNIKLISNISNFFLPPEL